MVPTFLLLIVLTAARTAVTSTISVSVERDPSSQPMLPAFLGGKPEDEQVRFSISNCQQLRDMLR